LVAVNNPTALDLIGEVVATAAAAVAVNMPGNPSPDVVRDGVDVEVGPGGRAVSARLAGAASGSIVIALAAPLAQVLEDGPLGPQDLVAALEPAMTDALASLEPVFGSPLRADAPYALEADLALSSLEGAVVTVPLMSADGVAGVFAVAVDMDDPEADELDGSGTAQSAGVAAATDMAFPDLDDGAPLGQRTDADPASLELLADVEMGVTAELGRTRMTVRSLLALTPGSVVELDRVAGSAVDLLVNGTLIARGEVVVIDDEFGVRITEILGRATPAGERRRR
jgi:flagellar motor switch protein FliN/FliY